VELSSTVKYNVGLLQMRNKQCDAGDGIRGTEIKPNRVSFKGSPVSKDITPK